MAVVPTSILPLALYCTHYTKYAIVSKHIAKISTILASSIQKLEAHNSNSTTAHGSASQTENTARNPGAFIIVALPSYCTNEEPKTHSFFLHEDEAEANQVPEPKTGFFVIIVVSIIFNSFSLCQ
jgi:hypothetical protein